MDAPLCKITTDDQWTVGHFVYREKPRPEWLKLRTRLTSRRKAT